MIRLNRKNQPSTIISRASKRRVIHVNVKFSGERLAHPDRTPQHAFVTSIMLKSPVNKSATRAVGLAVLRLVLLSVIFDFELRYQGLQTLYLL